MFVGSSAGESIVVDVDRIDGCSQVTYVLLAQDAVTGRRIDEIARVTILNDWLDSSTRGLLAAVIRDVADDVDPEDGEGADLSQPRSDVDTPVGVPAKVSQEEIDGAEVSAR